MNLETANGIPRIPPAITFEPFLPKPGETLEVHVTLVPKQIRQRSSLTLTLTAMESGAVVLTKYSCFVDETVDSFDVSLTLPSNIVPGFYRLILAHLDGEQVASEELIIIDAAAEESFQFSEAGLEAIMEAIAEERAEDAHSAAALLERAGAYYEQAGSFACAGLAYTDSAYAWHKLGNIDKATAVAWRATELLIRAEDPISAAPLVSWITELAPSLPETVAQYIEMGASCVESGSKSESNPETETKKSVILEIARKAFPQGAGFRFNLEALIKAMSSSRQNIHVPDINSLISLATCEKAIYSPGVLIRTPRGIGLRCATFVDEFVDDYIDDYEESVTETLQKAVARAGSAYEH